MYESGDNQYRQKNPTMTHNNNIMTNREYLQTEESSNTHFDRGKISFNKRKP